MAQLTLTDPRSVRLTTRHMIWLITLIMLLGGLALLGSQLGLDGVGSLLAHPAVRDLFIGEELREMKRLCEEVGSIYQWDEALQRCVAR